MALEFLFGQKKYIWVLMICLWNVGHAQQVFINLNINNGNLSITGSDRWVATVRNTTNQRVVCYLKATVNVQGDGLVANGVSRSFILNPLETKIINKQSTELFDSTRFEYKEYYRNAIIRTGELPSRRYDVCLTVFQIKTNLQLGENCLLIEPQKFLPPANIYPLPGDTLNEIANITFQWTAIQPLVAGTSYDLEITEIFGSQKQLSSFFSNPLFFESRGIQKNSFLYPLSVRKFISGRRYTWRVVGKVGTVRISSEPTFFVYKEQKTKPPAEKPAVRLLGVKSVLVLKTDSRIQETTRKDSLILKIPKAGKNYLTRVVITQDNGSSILEKLVSVAPGGTLVPFSAGNLKSGVVYRAMYTDINNQRQVIRLKIL